jgi:peptidylprolyl isomerase
MKQLFAVLMIIGLVTACSGQKNETTTNENVIQKKEQAVTISAPVGDIPALPEDAETITTASGMQFVDILVGEGDSPAAGNMVIVHYTGWLLNGKKFDSSVTGIRRSSSSLVPDR